MLAIKPKGRLNVAVKLLPCATLDTVEVSTGIGSTRTSRWLSGAWMRVGTPSDAGLHAIATGGFSRGSMGSQETCGSANVATRALLAASDKPSNPIAGTE